MRNDLVWVSPVLYSFAFENSCVEFMWEFYILAKLSPLWCFYQGNSRKPQLGKLLRRTQCSKTFHYQYHSTIGSHSEAMPLQSFHVRNVLCSTWSSEGTKKFIRLADLVSSTYCQTLRTLFGALFSNAVVLSANMGNVVFPLFIFFFLN